MKALFFFPILATAALAQLTDPGFELGTFNSSVRFGPTAVFVNSPAQAYEGSSFGAISVVAPSSGSLRTLTTFEAGLVDAGGIYNFSFYAKKPETNGFEEIRISASGGSTPVSRVTLDAPSSLTAVWMIHSYQFSIPADWNPENVLVISMSTIPISAFMGQTYSFHLDGISLTKIGVASVPEPQTWALGAGLVAMGAASFRRRRCSS